MVKTMDDKSGVSTPTRSYGGVAADERRAQRRTALLDAALDLLAEEGAAGVTKRAVCARAHLNDRYFYELFADRDALLAALAEDLTAQGIDSVVAATRSAAPDLHQQVRAAADAALSFLAADPRRNALLLNANTAEVLQSARLTTQHAIAGAMAAVTREIHPTSQRAARDVDMIAYTLVSGNLELVAAWMRGEFEADRDHLTELITGLLLAGTTH
ncbi:TetR family transcriptional regulator [Nocardia sp. NPDC003693]